MKIFAIYDKKAVNYAIPFFQLNKGIALRTFSEITNDEKTNLNKYPSDFSLWQLGDYDEKLGKIVTPAQPEFIDEAVNVIQKEK